MLNLCVKKARQRINALSRLASSISFEQRRIIMNSFVSIYNLPISTYRDFDSSLDEFVRRDSSTTFYQRNLQKLMTEIFKVKTGIAPELMKRVFEFADVAYNLKNQSKCSRSIPCTEWSKTMGQSSYRNIKFQIT